MINHRLFRILSESVISLSSSRNLLVIQTLPGTAHAAGEAVDTLGWEEILGTIAGDNTILAVIREDVATDSVLRRLEEIIG
jgi:transcriptional regulator of arginine metabolism